jgi:hypothetical protein
MAEATLPAPGVGEVTALVPSWRLHLEPSNLTDCQRRAIPLPLGGEHLRPDAVEGRCAIERAQEVV